MCGIDNNCLLVPSLTMMIVYGLRAILSFKFDLILTRSSFILMSFMVACEIDFISWIFNEKNIKENPTR